MADWAHGSLLGRREIWGWPVSGCEGYLHFRKELPFRRGLNLLTPCTRFQASPGHLRRNHKTSHLLVTEDPEPELRSKASLLSQFTMQLFLASGTSMLSACPQHAHFGLHLPGA